MLDTRYGPVGTRFSLILGDGLHFGLTLGTRFSILGTRIGFLKHLKNPGLMQGSRQSLSNNKL